MEMEEMDRQSEEQCSDTRERWKDVWTESVSVHAEGVHHAGHEYQRRLPGTRGIKQMVETERKRNMFAKSAEASPRCLLLPFLDILGQPLKALEQSFTRCRTAKKEVSV